MSLSQRTPHSPTNTEHHEIYAAKLSSTRTVWPIIIIILIAISLNEYQIYYLSHTSSKRDIIDATRGILTGHPPWKAFQDRLLGPLAFVGFDAAINWIRGISSSETKSLDAFFGVMIIIKNFVCFSLLLRYRHRPVIACAGTIFGSLLSVSLTDYWLYTWDLIELIIFNYLAYIIYSGKKLDFYFFVLYLLALSNRESAAFFGLWLLCHASAHKLVVGRMLWREAVIGIFILAFTIVYEWIVRNYLLVESTLGHERGIRWQSSSPIIPSQLSVIRPAGNHLDLIVNIETFARNLVSTHGYVDVFLVALALHAGLLVKTGFARRNCQLLAIGGFNFSLLVCLLMFALIDETRIFLICVPFVVFSAVTFYREIFSYFARIDCWSSAESDCS